ncbi:TRAP transporter small permease [Paenochrobactrum sp. BZR 588]|uniref:TRAP transporter small permease n=1 Tax=unclassified Paenochrobactrum TaxID=2639760 RepID=UPI0038541B19
MKTIEKFYDFILNLFAFLACLTLIAMMLATVIKVAMRVFFNYGIHGIDQISGIMMVYITFLGAAWVLRKDGHVTVDILMTIVSPPVRRAMLIISSIISAIVCLIMAYYGYHAIIRSIQRGIMVAAELEIPRAINLAVIPVGCFLLGVEFILRTLRFIRADNIQPSKPAEH